MVRAMQKDDYDEVYKLWKTIKGLAIRDLDDSFEGVSRMLERNPGFSVVAVEDNQIVGAILSGHDGRRGCLYHVCVAEAYRKRGIATEMVGYALERLKEAGIPKVSIIAFKKNRLGNGFWTGRGWTFREDLNYYDMVLDERNVTRFVE